MNVLPSPATSLRDEKSVFDVSSSNVAQFHGHFTKRSPLHNVEGLLCTVIMAFLDFALHLDLVDKSTVYAFSLRFH